MRLVVAGIDLSLTSTGIAIAVWDDSATGRPILSTEVRRVQSKGQAGASLAQRCARLGRLREQVVDLTSCADLVVIEQPAFSRTTGSMHDRSGLWWLVVDSLVGDWESRVVEVAPTARAKYATGAGNAGKDAVLAATVKRYPDWDITGNDVADAVILAAMGCRHLGRPIDSLPQIHLSAMTKVRWAATDPGEEA